jgi:hypothetical protein
MHCQSQRNLETLRSVLRSAVIKMREKEVHYVNLPPRG